MKERRAVIGGTPMTVTWTKSESGVHATVDGRTYQLTVRTTRSGSYWFGSEEGSCEAIVTGRDGGFDVSIGGRSVHVEFLDSIKARRRGNAGAESGVAEVFAPMPGKIVRILVEASAEVQENQGIVIMEAMKMQNEIRSPKSGKILELKVSEGDAVGLGDLIARVE
jgi:acetyl/propionyl-CoA carboxylase alpha subunit